MKRLAFVIVLLASPAGAQYYEVPNPMAQGSYQQFQSPVPPYGTGSNPSAHLTEGYTRRDGETVQPHWSTNPNGTQADNYGTRGNVNPYTGTTGTRSPRW